MTRSVRRPRSRVALAGLLGVTMLLIGAAPAAYAAATTASATTTNLNAVRAAILGIVEGLTEFLPISSTGHLILASRILGLPHTGAAGDAVKSYEIAIQLGAILAVLLLYRRRLGQIVRGLAGRDRHGRQLLAALTVAFIPAALVGLIAEKLIKDVLFGLWPVVVAWMLGGTVILVLSRRGLLHPGRGRALERITTRDAVIIGGAQILSLWPGTSRSLVTILAALLLGLTLSAAVEFSFLLGLTTLGAATAYEVLKNGSTMIDAYGIAVPVLGMAVAFVAGAASIKWMVTYLGRHDLRIFGWYRIAIAGVTIALMVTGAAS